MAGDWIKLTHAVLDKPEIRKTARLLGLKHGEALELYLRWWVWLDVNSVDGLVDQYVDQDVDGLLHCAGFSACMREVGWLITDLSTGKLRVVGFSSHNGETSKKRALRNRKQSTWRANVDRDVDRDVDRERSTEGSTREEKRRVLKQQSVVDTSDIDARATSGNNAFLKEGKPKPETKPAGRWDASESATDAKGRELGIPAKPGEDYFQYRRRLWSAINERSRTSN